MYKYIPNHFFLYHMFKINRITVAKYAFTFEQGAVANRYG
jgi:hypothetical protein